MKPKLFSRISAFGALELIYWAAFVVFIFLSNSFDWDHVFSFAEADRRSWLIDHNLPHWTYQLCGGVTRSGDPNFNGLSPFFAFTLLFGSFFGPKFLVIFLMTVGYFAIRRIQIWLCEGETSENRLINRSLCLTFLMSNFFLWHLGEGHVTFALISIGLFLIYFLLKAGRIPLSLSDHAWCCFLVFALFSGPFYHSILFFMIPICLSGLAWLLVVRPQGLAWNNLRHWILAGALGLSLSIYQLLGIVQYQGLHPRTLQNRAPEIPSWVKLGADFFLPTWNGMFIGTYGSVTGNIQEWSAFSPFVWLLLILLLIEAFRRTNVRNKTIFNLKKPELLFVGLSLFITFLFCLGERASWLPFALMNHFLLKDSAREVGRFQGAFLFEVLIALTLVLKNSDPLKTRWVRLGAPIILVLNLLNLFTFAPILSLTDLKKILSLPRKKVSEMKQLTLVHAPDFRNSFMHPEVLAGNVVLNCYEPLLRQMNVANTDGALKPMSRNPETGAIDLIENPNVSRDELKDCLSNSWVTQSELHIDPKACPVGSCLNLNGINPDPDLRQSEVPLKFSPDLGKFCITRR